MSDSTVVDWCDSQHWAWMVGLTVAFGLQPLPSSLEDVYYSGPGHVVRNIDLADTSDGYAFINPSSDPNIFNGQSLPVYHDPTMLWLGNSRNYPKVGHVRTYQDLKNLMHGYDKSKCGQYGYDVYLCRSHPIESTESTASIASINSSGRQIMPEYILTKAGAKFMRNIY